MLALQPAIVKLMDAGAPDYQWVRLNLPGALVIARDWALSEQKGDMLADPAGTGARHAWEWSEKADALGYDPANTLVLGINEPPVWDTGVIPALTAYTIAFLDGCAQHGLRGGALQLSVGWPGNNGAETPPDWAPFAGVEAAIRRGKHALVLHEYWATAGPGDGWGWYAGRFLKCPWDVPIVIGECGLDMGVVQDPSTLPGPRGWQGNVNAATYGAQVADYMRRCLADRRFMGGTVYLTDYQAGEWQSFDTEPARNELLAATAGLVAPPWYEEGTPVPIPPTPEPGPTPPVTGALVHPLPPGSYRITQRFNETDTNPAGHEGTDFGAAGGAPVGAIAEGVVAYAGFDDSYGWYVRVSHAALGCESFYAHLSVIDVALGEAVSAGDHIGGVGSTGNSTGTHLHLEIRLGAYGNYSPAAPKEWGRCDPETWAAVYGLSLATGDSAGVVSSIYMPIVSG